MNAPRSTGKLGALAERLKGELLEEPRPTVGRETLIIGFVLALIWVSLDYFRPEYPWLNAKFLVAAICLGLWGVADLLPLRLRGIAVVFRAAVWVLLLALGVWILASWFL